MTLISTAVWAQTKRLPSGRSEARALPATPASVQKVKSSLSLLDSLRSSNFARWSQSSRRARCVSFWVFKKIYAPTGKAGRQAGRKAVTGGRFSTANVWTKVTYFLFTPSNPGPSLQRQHIGVCATNNFWTESLFSSSRLLSGRTEGFVMRPQTGQKHWEKVVLLTEVERNQVQRHIYSK